MFNKRAYLVSFISLLGLVLPVCGNALEGLEKRSPFVPYDFKGRPGKGKQAGPLQFRGILQLGDSPEFSLYDTKAKKATWVKLQDKSAPFFVESYDPRLNSIKVQAGGRSQTLALEKPSDKPLAIAHERAAPKASKGQGSRNPKASGSKQPPRPKPGSGGPREKPSREEMSRRVYDAFKRYVEEKKRRKAQQQ